MIGARGRAAGLAVGVSGALAVAVAVAVDCIWRNGYRLRLLDRRCLDRGHVQVVERVEEFLAAIGWHLRRGAAFAQHRSALIILVRRAFCPVRPLKTMLHSVSSRVQRRVPFHSRCHARDAQTRDILTRMFRRTIVRQLAPSVREPVADRGRASARSIRSLRSSAATSPDSAEAVFRRSVHERRQPHVGRTEHRDVDFKLAQISS
jgi:hypothetical protein